MALLALFLSYYSAWVLALPFVEGPDWLRRAAARAFPARASVALGLPAAVGATLLAALLARAYWLVRQDRREEKAK